jgi:putative addiction module antidote
MVVTSDKPGRAASLRLGLRFCYNMRMNTQLKITKIGNSAGVVLPRELLAHLDASVGETLSVTKTARGIELSVRESDFETQMSAARDVMARRKRALRELAK